MTFGGKPLCLLWLNLLTVFLLGCNGKDGQEYIQYYASAEEFVSLVCSYDDGFTYTFEQNADNPTSADIYFCMDQWFSKDNGGAVYSQVVGFDIQGEAFVECLAEEEKSIRCKWIREVSGEQDFVSDYELKVNDFLLDNVSVDVDRLVLYIENLPKELAVRVTLGVGEYVFNKPLSLSRSVSLEGSSIDKTVVRFLGAGDALIVEAPITSELEFNIVSSLEASSLLDAVEGSGCNDVVISDIDSLWPFDERPYVFEGELNRIIPTDSGYEFRESLKGEYIGAVNVKVFCPLRVELSNFTLELAEGGIDQKAIAISRADSVVIEGVRISGAGKAGIWVAESSAVQIRNNILNGAFPEGCKTCYGIQTYGDVDVDISRNHIEGFRRGIDISGTIPSRRVLVFENTVIADSDVSLGTSALGTHGSADGVVFSSNYTFGGMLSMLLRGTDISVTNNNLNDAEYAAVYIADGARQFIYGNVLGGVRVNNTLTNRSVDFTVSDGHRYLNVSNNYLESKVPIRFGQTPGEFISTENISVFDL